MMIKQRERQQLGPKQQFTWLYLARRSDLQGAPVLIWPCLTNRDIYTDHISSSNIYHLILQTYKNEIEVPVQSQIQQTRDNSFKSNSPNTSSNIHTGKNKELQPPHKK